MFVGETWWSLLCWLREVHPGLEIFVWPRVTLQVGPIWCAYSWHRKIFIPYQKWCVFRGCEQLRTASIDFQFNSIKNVRSMWHSSPPLHCNATWWQRWHHCYASFHENNVIWILLTEDNDTRTLGAKGTVLKWGLSSDKKQVVPCLFAVF